MKSQTKSGSLYVVGLPIGNSEDITLRATKRLTEVDVVAAEDTRVFLGLCSELHLSPKKVVAHHEHNAAESTKELVLMMASGKSVALVSDAGTPRLSDPGFELISESYKNNIPVIPIPGVSAITAALSVAPIGGPSGHCFIGFLPSGAQERQRKLAELAEWKLPLVFFESPHRIETFLIQAHGVLGDRNVFIGREMTKDFEELIWSDLGSIAKDGLPFLPKGEFTVIIEGKRRDSASSESTVELRESIVKWLDQGTSPREILEKLRAISSLPRKSLYLLVEKIKKERG